MPRQYIIEHGTERNRWLYKIAGAGKKEDGVPTYCYRAQITDALVFKRAEALAIAKKWNARVWQVKGGLPIRQVYPEGTSPEGLATRNAATPKEAESAGRRRRERAGDTE